MNDINELLKFLLDRFDKLDDKVDKVSDCMVSHSKLLDDYNASLKEHIRRTEILESKVEPMYDKYTEKVLLDKLHEDKTAKSMSSWKKHAVIIGVISGVIAIIASILQLIKA